MKRLYIHILLVTFISLCSFLGFQLFNYYQNKNVIIENEITEDKARLSVVTFGERIEDKDIYFVQWESLNNKEKESALEKYEVFIFSSKEFPKRKYNEIIKELIKSKKTVLFFGSKINVKELLKGKNDIIPYYEIQSNKHIYYYLYGYGFSSEQKRMLPITIMGNFTIDKLDLFISNYLTKTYTNE